VVGGTFVFKVVSSSSYNVSALGISGVSYVDPIVIAAGGNGGNDGVHRSPIPGADGIATNGSTNTGMIDSTYGFTKKIVGTNYSKDRSNTLNQTGYGGYGCGRATDNNNGLGGGYTFGTSATSTNTGSSSYYNGTGSRISGENAGEGQVILNIISGKGNEIPQTESITVGKPITDIPAKYNNNFNIIKSKYNLNSSINNFRYFNKSDLEQIEIYDINRNLIINFYTGEVYDLDGVKTGGATYYAVKDLENQQKNVEYTQKSIGLPTFKIVTEKEGTSWNIKLENIVFVNNISTGTVSYKSVFDDYWTEIEGYTFLVNAPGSYEVKLTDSKGNENIETITVK